RRSRRRPRLPLAGRRNRSRHGPDRHQYARRDGQVAADAVRVRRDRHDIQGSQGTIMRNNAIVAEVKTLSCSNSFRNYHFLKITTEDGIVGWSEYDENFGSPGVTAIIQQ